MNGKLFPLIHNNGKRIDSPTSMGIDLFGTKFRRNIDIGTLNRDKEVRSYAEIILDVH
jgi:hypothetical protein